MVRAAANGRVYGVAGVLVITRARSEGGAWSVGAGRAWRTGALSARAQRGLAWACHVVQGLARLGAWTGGGSGRRRVSQTRLARLVLPLACWRHGGDNGALGMLTIDG